MLAESSGIGNNLFSIGDICILCKRTEKTIFGLALQKFVNFLGSGRTSTNGEQLYLILEWARIQKEVFALWALSAFHFEEDFVLSVVHIGQFESCFCRDLGDYL